MDVGFIKGFDNINNLFQEDVKIDEDVFSELFSSLMANFINQQNNINFSFKADNTKENQSINGTVNNIDLSSLNNMFILMNQIKDIKDNNATDEFENVLKELGIFSNAEDVKEKIDTILNSLDKKEDKKIENINLNNIKNEPNIKNGLTNLLEISKDEISKDKGKDVKTDLSENVDINDVNKDSNNIKSAKKEFIDELKKDIDINTQNKDSNKVYAKVNEEAKEIKPSEEKKISANMLFESVKEKHSNYEEGFAVINNEKDITQVVVEKFKTIRLPGFTEVRVKLRPQELGEVTVKVVLEKGQINGNIITEKKEVANMLISQIDNLKAELKNNNVNLNNISVSVSSDDNYNSFNNPNFFKDEKGNKKYDDSKKEFKENLKEDGFSIVV